MKCYFCEKNSIEQSYLGKLVMFILVMLVSTISFGVKLGTIKGLSKLSNYNELKDVETNKISNFQLRNRRPYMPINNFTGVGVVYLEGKVIGLYTMKNGISNGKSYIFYDNGQLKIQENWKDGKREGEAVSYYDDGQIETTTIFKDGKINLYKKYSNDGSFLFTYTQTSGNQGIMTSHTRDGNVEIIEKSQATYEEVDKERVLLWSTVFTKNGEFQIYNNKGRLIKEGIYKDNMISSSTKIDKFLGFIAQDSTYKVNVEDRDYFFKTLKELNLKGLTEEHYKEQVKLFGNKSFCSSLGMVIPQYYIFEGEPVQALIESYLLKMSKDIKKVSKKYTELNDKDFITKYFKSYCKVPSETSLSFVKDYNKDPKALREFLKNPVIK